MEGGSSPNADVARVAIRLPAFWTNRPASWFAQAEAQFHLAGITSEHTKFYHVIAQLGENYVDEVEDIINSPPQRDPYTTLKTELLKRLCPSKDQRALKFFEFEEMGDRKPSQFLRHLRSLAPEIPTDYLRILWSSRLPISVRTILAGLPGAELDEAARCADRIMETIPAPAVASMAPDPEYLDLKRTVRELSQQFAGFIVEQRRTNASLRQDNPRARRPRSNSRRRSFSSDNQRRAPARQDAASTVCWYHQRFGAQAQRCTTPCSFTQQGN
jgi:cleavage and polyadenylation specificity factor subunit 1